MRTWLKQIREQQNLTTAEIGNLSGISQSYYSLIENGMRGNPLNVDVAKRIAAVMHFDWTRFYEDDEE